MGLRPQHRKRRTMSGEGYAQEHYSVFEIARLWKLSQQTVKSLFLTEPGVLVIPSHPTQISIPASVADAVHRRLTTRPSAEGAVYDVFLAHNSKDKTAVEAIGRRLRRHGLNPWLDKWNIPPGRIFQREIDHAIRTARSIVIFIGPSGFGRWEQLEMEAAISQFVDRQAPVIPAFLPGVSFDVELPSFLASFNAVRFGTLNETEALSQLEWGITGIPKSGLASHQPKA